ncbi:MAG: ParB/RepB/Spo0J family partition protein [Vicinamibacterales bacterium]
MSDFDRVFLRKGPFVPSRDDDFDDHDADQPEHEQPEADSSSAAGREGLPSTFRMRATSHYVDLLASRPAAPPVHLIAIKDITGARPAGDDEDLGQLAESIRSVGVVQPLLVRRRKGRFELIAGSKRLAAAAAAGLTEVPCLLRDADDERARALAEAENLRTGSDRVAETPGAASSGVPALAAREIIDSLATIESCLNLFLDRERPLRERVAVSLVRAEAHRARWLAEAYSLLGSEPKVSKKGLNPVILVGRTLQGLESEGRLSNAKLALTIDEPTRVLVADERLMSVALTGAAGAMLGLLQGAGEAVLKIRVSTHPATRLLAIQFSQDLVAAPETRLPARGVQALPDWPGGHGASLGLAVARRVVELHGGQVDIGPGPRGGCTLTLKLPAGD